MTRQRPHVRRNRKGTTYKAGSRIIHSYHLYDPETNAEYSANAGDYWNLEPEHIFKNEGGDYLWLIRDGDVFKKIVRKKDLKDEIYEEMKRQQSLFNKRRSVGRKKLFTLSAGNEVYIVNNRGSITQYGRKDFSKQWLLVGLANRWNNLVITWDEILRNPERIKSLQKPLYVVDLDHGTKRIWSSQKFNYIMESN